MIKNLVVIDSDNQGNPISNSIHLTPLFHGFESKQLNILRITPEFALSKPIWSGNEHGMLIVHSFKTWKNDFHTLLSKVEIPVFAVPTEMLDSTRMQTEFGHKSISKVVVATESYQKHFVKNIKLEANRVKTLYLPTGDYRPIDHASKQKRKDRIIVVPGLIHADKDFETVLMAARRLKSRFRNFIFAFCLKKHPSVSESEKEDVLRFIYDFIVTNKLQDHVKVLLDKEPYDSFLRIADVVVIPPEKNNDMYAGTLMDALMAHRAIITPNTKMAQDLCKKDAGIYLYETERNGVPLEQAEIVENLYDDCSIVFESKDIKEIMQEQNSLLSENYLFPKIAQQYLNLARRYKN